MKTLFYIFLFVYALFMTQLDLKFKALEARAECSAYEGIWYEKSNYCFKR